MRRKDRGGGRMRGQDRGWGERERGRGRGWEGGGRGERGRGWGEREGRLRGEVVRLEKDSSQ